MIEKAIDPDKLKGWKIVRTFPGNVMPAFPELMWDYLEIWRGGEQAQWFCGYDVDDSEKWRDHVTIFDTYEYADSILVMVEQRYSLRNQEGVKFLIVPHYG
jgi:hypothetical protein